MRAPGLLLALLPLAAAGLAALPLWRAGAALSSLPAAIAALILACLLPWWAIGEGVLATGRLAPGAAPVVALVWLSSTWSGRRADRQATMPMHLLAAAVLASVLAASLPVACLGVTAGAAVLIAALRRHGSDAAARKLTIAAATGSGLLLFGTLAMTAPSGPHALVAACLLAGLAAIAGLAPLHGWLLDGLAGLPAPLAGFAAGGLLPAAVLLLLRLPGPPGPAGGGAMAAGLLSLAIAAIAVFGIAEPRQRLALGGLGQFGVAAFAFGLGGERAVAAGLLHLAVLALVLAAAWQSPATGLARAAALGALAGLPPSGLFATTLLIAGEAMRRAPMLALPLGIGAVALGSGLALRLRDEAGGARNGWGEGVVWAQLAAATVLGLATPAPLAAWLGSAAAALAPL